MYEIALVTCAKKKCTAEAQIDCILPTPASFFFFLFSLSPLSSLLSLYLSICGGEIDMQDASFKQAQRLLFFFFFFFLFSFACSSRSNPSLEYIDDLV